MTNASQNIMTLPCATKDMVEEMWVAIGAQLRPGATDEELKADLAAVIEYDADMAAIQEYDKDRSSETEPDTDEEPEDLTDRQRAIQIGKIEKRLSSIRRKYSELREEEDMLKRKRQTILYYYN